MNMVNEQFARFARFVAIQCGHAFAFVLALILILAWLGGGFYFGFDNQLYQLIINTVTTIITFLMVFILQHTQNRDTLAIQLKLDELIAASAKASNRMQAIEDLNESQLQAVKVTRRKGRTT